jgi:hypothetical protein
MWKNNYKPDADYDKPLFEEGEYTVKIVEARETVSNSGKNMFKLTFEEVKTKWEFYFFIVEGEYFAKNITKFFDCFGIPRGTFDVDEWRNKHGGVYIAKGKPKENGNSYFEIKRLIVDKPPQANASEQLRQDSARKQEQFIAQSAPPAKNSADNSFTDDIPF